MNELTANSLPVRVVAMRQEAAGVVSVELASKDAAALPAFKAGAHIDVTLANGMTRQYSLINSEAETHRYVVAVSREERGRGGSKYIHDKLRVGDSVAVSSPRNNFPLAEEGTNSVLIAGGIGVTPLLCMARRLEALGRRWKLFLCARNQQHAAFADEGAHIALQHGTVIRHFEDTAAARFLDIAQVIQAEPPQTHFYCCGPEAMLNVFEAEARKQLPAAFVHVERFKPREADVCGDNAFSVELDRSGRRYQIEPGRSILDVLLEGGEPLMFSCKEGVCGACEVGVLEGLPDHRDSVLSEEERSGNATMMLCVSRCKGKSLRLDC